MRKYLILVILGGLGLAVCLTTAAGAPSSAERELVARLHFIGTADMAGSVAATNLNSMRRSPTGHQLRCATCS